MLFIDLILITFHSYLNINGFRIPYLLVWDVSLLVLLQQSMHDLHAWSNCSGKVNFYGILCGVVAF